MTNPRWDAAHAEISAVLKQAGAETPELLAAINGVGAAARAQGVVSLGLASGDARRHWDASQ